MSTTPANAADSPDIQHTRWRIDPERSSVEFHVRNFYGLQTVKGRFDVTTFADHRELRMTWNRLGMLRGPSKLIIRGRLVRDDG